MAWLLLILSAPARSASLDAGGDPESWFREANAAYAAGKFPEAAELYQRVLNQGIRDPRAYFNYGNTLFRMNHLGLAILNYERALQLAPSDPDIQYNLRFANSRTQDKIQPPEPGALEKAAWEWHSLLTLDQGLWVCLAAFSGLFLFAAAAIFLSPAWKGLSIAGLALSALALLAVAPSVTYKIIRAETRSFGIVLEPSVEILSGPGEHFQVLAKVHEGAKFEILSIEGEWASVKLMNGMGGYVRLKGLGRLG